MDNAKFFGNNVLWNLLILATSTNLEENNQIRALDY